VQNPLQIILIPRRLLNMALLLATLKGKTPPLVPMDLHEHTGQEATEVRMGMVEVTAGHLGLSVVAAATRPLDSHPATIPIDACRPSVALKNKTYLPPTSHDEKTH